MGTTDQDITKHPLPLPSGSALDTDMDQNLAPGTTPPSQTTLGCRGEQSHQGNHVESSTPPSDSDLGKQQDGRLTGKGKCRLIHLILSS